jgi:predicted lipid-binding transport protein (Tim44 family)
VISDFWSELFRSVGQLLKPDRQELVFSDQSDTTMLTAAQIQAQTAPPAAASMLTQAKAQLASLQQVDTNFSERDFLTAAAKIYNALLAAEGAMDPEQIASLVTPNFLSCFRQRIQKWRDAGFTRTVSDVCLDPPMTMKLSVDADQEAITVRFTGTARRFTKEDMTNLVTEGSAQTDSFTEFVAFVRPAGSTTPARTANGAPVHCPSCGAPADSGALKCAYCGAPLTGTGGTWLLDHTSDSAYT